MYTQKLILRFTFSSVVSLYFVKNLNLTTTPDHQIQRTIFLFQHLSASTYNNPYINHSWYLLLSGNGLIPDSEDSDNESGMGNVSRLVMRPPGHSGKAKRGHLCFDASFETGKETDKLWLA